MDYAHDSRLPVLVQSALFFIPVNIYVIGDWLARGLQWSTFRYQQSDMGSSLIGFSKDLTYLQENILKGSSALAAECNLVASALMILTFFILVFALTDKPGCWIKYGALCSICGGIFFLAADIVQYGIFLNGASGFVIPIGVPIILVAGIWMYRTDFKNSGTGGSAEAVTK
ncbi:hypothetical protein [Methanoregula sp. UBA64]|jgi:hypothetical protein|uniref:hypothetical protein n=1 Tax=Methanoregula sp. UBA64 TaxID=1915554 RepID=UPI0025FB2E4A|nr:hypothetical protein [Methanoregula sp. UBA64]